MVLLKRWNDIAKEYISQFFIIIIANKLIFLRIKNTKVYQGKHEKRNNKNISIIFTNLKTNSFTV